PLLPRQTPNMPAVLTDHLYLKKLQNSNCDCRPDRLLSITNSKTTAVRMKYTTAF
ncbi:28348_t:CDS:2, partial [Racocetra persica]